MIKFTIQKLLLCLTIMMCMLSILGCQKFLDEKPDSTLAIPGSLTDLQGLLDNYPAINNQDLLSGEVSADNYYLTDASWKSLTLDGERRMYLWDEGYFFENQPNEWGNCYANIYIANTVLEKIGGIERNQKNQVEWDNIKGQALLIRGRSYMQLAFIYCLAYNESSSKNDLGLPIRKNTDFNITSVRSTLADTYHQILSDLSLAADLLPDKPIHVIRGSKAAAYGFLSRTYLAMRRYSEAGKYAGLCLEIKNEIIDYKKLSPNASYPFSQFNVEVIHESMCPPLRPLRNNFAKINLDLYLSYTEDDLRKSLFFGKNSDNTFFFKGSYEGGAALFTGLATDEVYLTRAECYARSGDLDNAAKDLHSLLSLRIRNYIKPVFIDQQAAINYVLAERRKQLIMRGIRWVDIKRLNAEGYGITLERKIDGITSVLKPNSPRYALPIPEEIIERSGMKQNPR